MLNGRNNSNYANALIQDNLTDIAYSEITGRRGFFGGNFSGLAHGRSGFNDWIEGYDARLFLAVNMNKLPSSDQVLEISIPSNDGVNNTIKLLFKKGPNHNQNWIEVICIK